jgi:hypothetical protein
MRQGGTPSTADNRKESKMTTSKYRQDREARTARIIAKWRGLPGEFYMLKGLLCLDSAIPDSAATWAEQMMARRIVTNLYDAVAIARRMDEINAEALKATA